MNVNNNKPINLPSIGSQFQVGKRQRSKYREKSGDKNNNSVKKNSNMILDAFKSMMGVQRYNLDMTTPMETHTDRLPTGLGGSVNNRRCGNSAKTNKSIKTNFWYNHRMSNSVDNSFSRYDISRSYDFQGNNDSILDFKIDDVSRKNSGNSSNRLANIKTPKIMQKRSQLFCKTNQPEETFDEWYFLSKNNNLLKRKQNIKIDSNSQLQNSNKLMNNKINYEKHNTSQEENSYLTKDKPMSNKLTMEKEVDEWAEKEKTNSNILDELVLKEIKKNGQPVGDNKDNKNKVIQYGSINWNSGNVKYFLSLIYQEKCKKFDTLSHLQGKKFHERSTNLAAQETKANNVFGGRTNSQTKKEYKRELYFHRKKYWECALKLRIKIYWVKKMSEMILQKLGKPYGSFLENPEALQIELKSIDIHDLEKKQTLKQSQGLQSPTKVGHLFNHNALDTIVKRVSNRKISTRSVDISNNFLIEDQIRDLTNMTERLKILKLEKKSQKLKLRKICKFLLMNQDIMFEEEITPCEVIIQLWEINQKINYDMLSPQFDDSSKEYYLKMSALEKLQTLSQTHDEFFNQYIIGNYYVYKINRSTKVLESKLETYYRFFI